LTTDFYKDVARMLIDAGWNKTDGGKGSHEKWRHPISGKTVIVPRRRAGTPRMRF
jgi:predicted RNA binding protein YcfA (HicA-like mRNA interferase family)